MNNRTKTFHSLGEKFIRSMVDAWISPNTLFPPNYEGKDLADWDTLRRKVCFALDVLPEARLPERHAGAGYEGPLVAVLTERYKQKGRRLDDWRVGTLRTLGWWERVRDEPTKLNCRLMNITVVVPLTPAQIAEGGNWVLTDNEYWNMAKFASDDGTHNLLVCKLASRQHPQLQITQDASGFEAAAGFGDSEAAPASVVTSPAASTMAPSPLSAGSPGALGDGPSLPPCEAPGAADFLAE